MNVLVVVDMQNDFIDGSLGTPEAQAIVPNVCAEILHGTYDHIFVTQDSHFKNYSSTLEGRLLPVEHCIFETPGWKINQEVQEALNKAEETKEVFYTIKGTFGSINLMDNLAYLHYNTKGERITSITFIGLCTDICVISNALGARMVLPDVPIYVCEAACAGTAPAKHQAAIDVMRSCQILPVKGV